MRQKKGTRLQMNGGNTCQVVNQAVFMPGRKKRGEEEQAKGAWPHSHIGWLDMDAAGSSAWSDESA
jgi:hypothetical protein